MWLFWLKLFSIFVIVLSGVIAAYREMHPKTRSTKIPTVLFVLAISFGATAIATEFVGYYVQKEAEQERAADLQYIQALDLPILRVGFDLALRPAPTSEDLELQWMFRFEKKLPTVRGLRPFVQTINLHFSPDSGWTMMTERWRGITLDTSADHLKFWIYDLGFKEDAIVVWQPKRVVDLTGLEIQMLFGAHDPMQALPLNYESLIQQVDIYVNSFTHRNCIVVAMPHRWSAGSFHFVPKGPTPFVDTRNGIFYLNPYELRSSILEAIKEGD
ncbi:MAG: hypothetical protein KAW16_09590 [candidate division Zixibacteria bacterium]|nr:hypothetical protein [candidate division Zixibacteria bacterium]